MQCWFESHAGPVPPFPLSFCMIALFINWNLNIIWIFGSFSFSFRFGIQYPHQLLRANVFIFIGQSKKKSAFRIWYNQCSIFIRPFFSWFTLYYISIFLFFSLSMAVAFCLLFHWFIPSLSFCTIFYHPCSSLTWRYNWKKNYWTRFISIFCMWPEFQMKCKRNKMCTQTKSDDIERRIYSFVFVC